ncbi:uncharacterized protein Bfra_003351 [Botrytis fragariae]|uniref:Uncharacterized protein n=1 Tax=Botrytis fragariae TaxID=1964551 RepID=A0A8H6AWX9_9HELO|nr:uncharacterized protein Bfra_003351 [Botrytis fragariae]KAF5874900.1 hypothetical protein Bfra_003351 [Botrytis fragariae]
MAGWKKRRIRFDLVKNDGKGGVVGSKGKVTRHLKIEMEIEIESRSQLFKTKTRGETRAPAEDTVKWFNSAKNRAREVAHYD